MHGLLGAGAKVAALDIDETRLEALAAGLAQAREAGRLVTMRTDISRYEECEAAVEHTRASLGGLHILVNNGALGMGVIRIDHMTELVEIDEITPETWDRFVAVNLSGGWYMTRAAIGGMLESGLGAHRERHHELLHDAARKVSSLRTGQGGDSKRCPRDTPRSSRAGGVTVNVVVPGGPSDTPMVPMEGRLRSQRHGPALGDGAADPVALLGGGRVRIPDTVTVAAQWDAAADPVAAAQGCRAPIGWPDLAQSPVWPGGKPDE